MSQITDLSKGQRVAMLRTFNVDAGWRVMEADQEQAECAAVVANGLLAFVKGVSKKYRQDAQNAYLYATMAADKKCGNYGEGEQWYKVFCDVMGLAGWVVKESSFRSYNATERNFSMEKVAIEILKGAVIAAAMGPAGTVSALETARKAVDAVGKDDEAVTLFDRSAKKDRGGNFGIGSVVEEDGDVCMALGIVQYKGAKATTSVLFSKWDRADLEIYQAKTVFWMDEMGVEDSRDEIRSIIREARKKKMKETPI
ncbi:hypothetical protein [Pseudomonas eucalypticola]|uniref:Uncharacterized protein n=1 Tax=Pseudomonas eucalypticola TaxID=2599595 RepID=A0A7D5HLB2_9PSED|nr:hypothetical protein [Pseudomonas eucalypticola]QKZ02848.1 hypothetical protein HWQ56_03130 [Pseudomonas eucalypticola]